MIFVFIVRIKRYKNNNAVLQNEERRFSFHGGFDMAFGLLNHRIRDPRVKPEDDTYVITRLAPETSSG